jgi:hypothetical protein
MAVLSACALGAWFIGLFLQRRGLDEADKLASVVGLFVGIAGLAVSAIGLARHGPRVRRASSSGERPSPSAATPTASAGAPTASAGPATASAGSQTASARPAGVAAATATAATASAGAVAGPDLAADLDRLRAVTNVDHDRLFGVDGELAALAASLRSRDGGWIISVWGGPGVGKTALAYELVKRHAATAGFGRVASVSAKFSHLDRIGHMATDTRRAAIDWHDLLVEIAQQLAPGHDFTAGLIEQQLPQALPSEPCLIFVDNLETTLEAEVAVRYFASRNVTDPHKVVLTTRESVAGLAVRGLRERRWDGPDRTAAREYAKYLAGDDPTLDPTDRDLDDVVAVAERAPLLIQIIINQAREARLSIREVIDRLRDVGGHLGSAVWSYCYVHSLNVLAERVGEEATANLMSVFCYRPAGSSFTSEEFFLLSGIEDREVFHQARAMACKLALVRSLAGNTKFTVHSLLREFYCTGREAADDPHARRSPVADQVQPDEI